MGLASSKDTRESNAAEPLAGEADVLTTPREDAIPASTVLGGASPAKIVAKRHGLCAKFAVARKRARAGKKAAKIREPTATLRPMTTRTTLTLRTTATRMMCLRTSK